jgi:hypothetical protein
MVNLPHNQNGDGILLRLRTPSSVGQRLSEGYLVGLRYGL